MILRCCRPPRSGGRWAMREALTVIPTARFSPIALCAIEAAAWMATSVVDASPWPAWMLALEVEDDPRIGRLLQLELLDLDLPVAGGHPPMDPVHAVARRIGSDRRNEWRGLQRPFRGGVAAFEAGGRQSPGRQRLQLRVDDRPTRPARPWPRLRRTRTDRPSGYGAARCGSGHDASNGARTSQDRSLRPPRLMARPGSEPGSVVGLWISSHGFGIRLPLRSVYVTRIWSPT